MRSIDFFYKFGTLSQIVLVKVVMHNMGYKYGDYNTELSIASSSEGKSDMFQYFSTILYVHFGNPKSTS